MKNCINIKIWEYGISVKYIQIKKWTKNLKIAKNLKIMLLLFKNII